MADRAPHPGFRFPGPVPEETLDHLRARRPWDRHFPCRDVWLYEHAYAFIVAKALEMDLLKDLRAEIAQAIAEGRTIAQFQKDLTPILRKRGWWGKKALTDPKTGQTAPTQPDSPNRLRTIYRSNLRAARAAGQWDRAQRTKKTRPYFLYELGPGEKHRDRHRAWAGTILPVDDPWWNDHIPPNGRDCDCRVRQISEAEAERRGGATARPPRHSRTMTNPRPGMRFEVDRGLDPAWASNPGKFRGKILMDHLNGTIEAAHPADARAAILSFRQGPIPHWFHRRARTFAKENPEIANAERVEIEDQAFKDRLGHLPVALFGDRARAQMKPLTEPKVTPTRLVLLSPENAVKQVGHHPTIGMSDYRFLDEMIEKGETFESRKAHHLLFFRRFDGQLYEAVVKQTRNNELFLLSFHRAHRRNLEEARQRTGTSPK